MTYISSLPAQTELRSMIDRPTVDPNRTDTDSYDIAQEILRDLIFEAADYDALDIAYYKTAYPEFETTIEPTAKRLAELLDTIYGDTFAKQFTTLLALEYSICPVHIVDYIMCFQDNEPGCDQIREYFPDRDS